MHSGTGNLPFFSRRREGGTRSQDVVGDEVEASDETLGGPEMERFATGERRRKPLRAKGYEPFYSFQEGVTEVMAYATNPAD